MPPLGLSCPVLRWTLDSVVVPVLARCKPGQTTACCPHYPPSPAITQHSPHNTHRSNAHHPPPTTHHPPPATRAACTHARTHTRSKQAASKQHTHTHPHTHVCQKCLSVCTGPEAATKVVMRQSCVAWLGLDAHGMHSAVSPTTSMSCLHW